jgi:hypothetical protein
MGMIQGKTIIQAYLVTLENVIFNSQSCLFAELVDSHIALICHRNWKVNVVLFAF